MTFKNRHIIIWIFSFLILTEPYLTAETKIIRARKIYTVSNGIIEDGMILIKNNKIASVEKHSSVPDDTEIIDAIIVIPGLVDMHSHLGVYSTPYVKENEDGNEMTNPVTPQVRALDSFNFDDPAIPIGLAGGVTTIVSRPGSGNVIGGTSVAVKLKNAHPDEMVLKEICDLKMAIEGNPIGVYGAKNQAPSTLMSVYHLAEKAFVEAKDYIKEWNDYESKKKKEEDVKPPKRDLGKEALAMALKGEIPVHIHCATASEIMSCIRLADTFGLKLSLGHAYFAHLLIDELRDRKKDIHFNIGPPMFFTYYQDDLVFKNNPAILSNEGYSVSLQTDAIGNQQNLRHLAALCVRYGMDENEALKAITLAPAEACFLGDRIGSIEKGKDADLALLDGEPFSFLSKVEKVLIDGKIEYESDRSDKQKIENISPAKNKLILPSDIEKSDKIAIKAGMVYTMAGNPVENGTVLIEKGKIKKIGADISIPTGYKLIDASDFVMMPGLVSPRSYLGIMSNWRRQSHTDEKSGSVLPALEVKHAIEPHAPHFTFARDVGVTTTLVTPGDENVIGGQGTVIKTSGVVVDKMIIKDKAVMMLGLGTSAKRENQMPSTRMGIAAILRETLIKAREYKQKTDTAKKEEDKPKRDLDMEALLPVLEGKTPVMIHCERKDDILTALRIADEFGLNVILDGATDAYKLIDDIKQRKIPVIVENLFRGAGNVEDKDFNPRMPALLSEAGISIAFRSNLDIGWIAPCPGWPGGDPLEVAAFAVKNGMNPDKALRAVTIDAAKIVGLDERIGSLEAGKDADILVLRGHPLATQSVPEAVFIEGKLVYQRQDGVRLHVAN